MTPCPKCQELQAIPQQKARRCLKSPATSTPDRRVPLSIKQGYREKQSTKCHRPMLNKKLISRREALQHLSAGSLLALGLWPGALRAGDSNNSGNFRFLVINDTHYVGAECGRWLEGVVRQMKSHGPVEFCLH